VLEGGAFAFLRLHAADAVRWMAARLGRNLFELPLVKTAYIGFGVSIIALAWVKLCGERWTEYGLKSMKSLWRLLATAVLLVGVYLAYAILLEPVVDAFVLANFGGDKTAAANTFKDVVGDFSLFLYVLPFIWLFGAFGEEFFYRGFLMTKIARGLGESRAAWIVAVILQALIFGLAHAYQGPVGIVGTGMTGLIYGFATLVCGRSLWPAILAHGAIDTLGFTLLYLGQVETA
jgi:membrane protease YdiL (CAAX protease family)